MPTESSDAKLKSLIAGGGAGLTSAVVTCPIDMIKIRIQNLAEARATIIGTIKSIVQNEGVRGLFKGVGPTAASYLPTWAIFFTVFDSSKRYYKEQFPLLSHANVHVLSALQGGICSALLTNPLFVVRTRIMTQPAVYTPCTPYFYRSTLDGLITISRNEGLKSLYKGIVPTLFGASHVAIQFPLYEQLKQNLSRNGEDHTFSILAASAISKIIASCVTYPHEVIRTRLQTQAKLPVGNEPQAAVSYHCQSRNISTTAYSSIPLVKKPKYKGLVQTGKVIVHLEGWRGLYKGFYTSLLRNVPASALTILTYEFLNGLLKEI